jgi:hypothetical protein
MSLVENPTQIGRIRWLLVEAAKASGIQVSDETISRITIQMSRLMTEDCMEMVWMRTEVEADLATGEE